MTTTTPTPSPLAANDDAGARLAEFAAALTYDAVDDAARAATKRLTLDCLGAGIAAVAEPGVAELRELALDWGGKPEATPIGSATRIPAHHAAAVNATACRALEIDDVHELAVIHTSATVVPVALAMVEASPEPVSGADLIAAIAAGTEVAIRLSTASRVGVDGEFRPRIWSSTNLVGTICAAVTAARVAGADAVTMLHALGFGYSNTAATKQGLADKALSVRVQQGLCAGNGVVGAQLALRGLTGPTHPLEGAFGLYTSFWGGVYDRDLLLDGLGDRLGIADVSIKPYPCCKFTHTGVAAAVAAGRDPRFSPDAVRRVELAVESEEYFATVCAGVDERRRPQTAVQAQFSLPYVAAVGLVRGGVAFADVAPPFDDPEVARVAAVVDCVLVPAERRFPSPTSIRIELADGSTIEARAELAPGHPDLPLSWDEVVAKFEACCDFAPTSPSAAQRAELVAAVAGLDELADARTLGRLLAW